MDNKILNNNVAKAYLEFEVFRAEFIKKWCQRASFKEERKNGNVRPVVLLKTNEMLNEFKADLETDKRLLAVLSSEPESFSPKATKYKPILEAFRGVSKVSISQPPATNSRKKSKDEILRSLGRLVDRLDHTVLTTGTQHSIDALSIANEEYQSIRDNSEEVYRVRTYGYTDTAVYLAQHGITQDKIRIPLTGIFIVTIKNECLVVVQEKSDPKNAIKSYPVTPVPCSAILKGMLYRQSDIDAHNDEVKKKNS